MKKLQEYDKANYEGIHTRNKQLPKGANKLSARLFELQQDLKVIGYTIERSKTSDRAARRIVTIEYKEPEEKRPVPLPSEEANQSSESSNRPKEENQAQSETIASDDTSSASFLSSKQSSEIFPLIQAQKTASDASDYSDDSFPTLNKGEGRDAQKFSCSRCQATFANVSMLKEHREGHAKELL